MYKGTPIEVASEKERDELIAKYKAEIERIKELNNKHESTRQDCGFSSSEDKTDGVHNDIASLNQSRINMLKEDIDRIKVVNKTVEEGSVGFGNVVTVEYPDGDIGKFKISSTNGREGDVFKITSMAPLAKAIFGKKEGDFCSYKVGNNEFIVKIIAVEKQKKSEEEPKGLGE